MDSIEVSGISFPSIPMEEAKVEEVGVARSEDDGDKPLDGGLSQKITSSKTRNSISNYQRIQICRKKRDNPNITQAELKSWMKETYGIEISQVS